MTIVARRTGVALTAVLAPLLCGWVIVVQPSSIRLLVAAGLVLCGVVVAAQSPRSSMMLVLAFLPFLALLRRLLLEYTTWSAWDPILLVAPVVLGVVLVRAFVLERREPLPDAISKLVAALVLLSGIQAFNPRGGSVTAGAAALLYTAVPLLWFFAGREFATRRSLQSLFTWIVLAGGAIASYGLVQTWNGLPSWDRVWVEQTNYAALRIGTTIRAFGTFSSAAEYASFLGAVLVIAIAFALCRRLYLLAFVPLVAVAVFYDSSRGILFTTVAGVIAVVAARTGSLRRATLTLVVCLAALAAVFAFGESAIQQTAATSTDPLVSHQLSGIASPLGSASTLPIHLSMVRQGFTKGILDPIGHGIATTTVAGSRLNGSGGSTEADVSDAFVAYGTVGGIAYLALVLLVLRRALRRAVQTRGVVELASLGLLVTLAGQWLNGGFYALPPLLWAVIGFVVADESRVELDLSNPQERLA